jgi:hypothetical protein
MHLNFRLSFDFLEQNGQLETEIPGVKWGSRVGVVFAHILKRNGVSHWVSHQILTSLSVLRGPSPPRER